jgi:hypothetical protein
MNSPVPLPAASPGWYPDPGGAYSLRYWDGWAWTGSYAPMPQRTAVVEGPNHALHAILTLFTFWACGGWAWIWLIVALSNRKHVRYV